MKAKTICIIFSILLSSIIGCHPAEHEKHNVHWGYEGEGGPSHWGHLKPEFELCSTGKSQSPIDFDQTYQIPLNSIEFSYKDTPLKIINNGHAIQVNYEPGSLVKINGKTYELLQLHFHAPSEHTVKGNFYDMEMHLVHKNDQGELAVVGVLMTKGKSNKTIQTIWDNIPNEINKEDVVNQITVNASGLLTNKSGYYRYFGSLTTPPCSEGVYWNVLKTPIEVSEEQVEKFRSVMGVGTNRPVQALNKRFVLETK